MFKFVLLLLISSSSLAQVSPASPILSPEPLSFTEKVSWFFEIEKKVELSNLEGFNALEMDRLQHIAKNVQTIVNSAEFAERVKNHRVVTYTKADVAFWNISSPLKMPASEALATTMRSDWQVDYRGYCERTSTVGYTYASVKWIKLNKCHSNFKQDHLIAQNMCHEYGGHKRGFAHAARWDKYRDYSYPYAIGKICNQMYVARFKPWSKK